MLRITALLCYLLMDYGFFFNSYTDVYSGIIFMLMIGAFYYALRRTEATTNESANS